MLTSFATQTVTVVRPGRKTVHGAAVDDWETATTHDIEECLLVPQGGTEQLANRDAVNTRWTLLAPSGADLNATDHVRAYGFEYAVDGPVQRWPSATGALDHAQATLNLWEG